jgi:hypothetical protein
MKCAILLSLCCAACGSQTSGERVRVSWEMVQAPPEDRTDFETSTGYRVHLDEARIELKAVYLYAPASAGPSAVAWFERQLVAVAHAHGGVDVEKGRRVLAEWTKAMSVDALSAAPVRLSETDAEGGLVDAVKLQLADGVVAHVRGHAERDGQRWTFEAAIEPNVDVQRSVELLSLNESIGAGSLVQVTVHPRTWLDLCEFERLPEDAATVAPDNQVGRAINIGVRSPDAFSLQIVSEK